MRQMDVLMQLLQKHSKRDSLAMTSASRKIVSDLDWGVIESTIS
jgi:hypothetical protein